MQVPEGIVANTTKALQIKKFEPVRVIARQGASPLSAIRLLQIELTVNRRY